MEKDLIFEIGSEELPAGFIHRALKELESIFKKRLKESSLEFKTIRTLGTPRRITVIVEGLSEKEPDATVEVRGPNRNAAYDKDGNPTPALLGFARAHGLPPAGLKTVRTDKGEYLYAVKKVKGRPTEELLPDFLKSVLSSLVFPRAMRWGDHEITYGRPLHWLLALYAGETVGFEYGHIKSGGKTRGHRFFKPRKAGIKVKGVSEYIEKLRENRVIVDPAERRALISKGLEKEARKAGGSLLKDDDLMEEVVNLVEYPAVIPGSFDREFLSLPFGVVVNAMREHQRYFSIVDGKGGLLPYFLTVANTPVEDIGVVAEGNERVLRARLNDAKFYFGKDIKVPLRQRVSQLKGVLFQSSLGTSYEKVERFTRLALFIGHGIGFSDPLYGWDSLEYFLTDDYRRFKDNTPVYNKCVLARAALLSKADLTSGMVGEFPKLQGIMGREYARREDEPLEVSEAIYEHYLPTSFAGDLPASQVGAIISIADKLDTIAGCFGVGLIPTGEGDPYGLRRQALGIIAIILDKGYTLPLDVLVDTALCLLKDKLTRKKEEARADVLEFFKERLRNQLLMQKLSHDSVEAVLSSPWFDVCDAVKRVLALEKFKTHPACPHLAIAFKRVSNILKGQEVLSTMPDERLFSDPREKALWDVSKNITPVIQGHWLKGDYEKVFETLASIKDVIDKFFDKVLVMTEDERLRTNRLILLSYVRGLYFQIADISKLVV